MCTVIFGQALAEKTNKKSSYISWLIIWTIYCLLLSSIHLIPIEWFHEIFVLITTDLSHSRTISMNYEVVVGTLQLQTLTTSQAMDFSHQNQWICGWSFGRPMPENSFRRTSKPLCKRHICAPFVRAKRAKTFDSTQRVITWGMTSSAHHNQPTAQLMLYCPFPYSLADPILSLHLCFSLTIIGICCSCIGVFGSFLLPVQNSAKALQIS